jgi:hypothetical protein
MYYEHEFLEDIQKSQHFALVVLLLVGTLEPW